MKSDSSEEEKDIIPNIVLTPRTRARKFLELKKYQKLITKQQLLNEDELLSHQQLIKEKIKETLNNDKTIVNVKPRKSMIQTPSTDNLIRRDTIFKNKHCCEAIRNNCYFLCAQVKAKFRDDLLIGQEHSKRILPDCNSPSQNLLVQKDDLTDEEKIEIVCSDPKFGMFSLFKYHLHRGYRNEVLKSKNAFYCSHIFSLLFMLPILIFLIQWITYIGLVVSDSKSFNKGFCPNESTIEMKMIMMAVSMLYFVRSFFLWII